MSTEYEKSAQAGEGRDDKGRFSYGNQGGPGNPFARKVAALRKALIDSVTAQDIQDVATRLVALAKEGNVPAAKLLLAYTLGKPEPVPQPDRMNVDEFEIHRETAQLKKESATLMNAATPEFYLNSIRAVQPVMSFLHRNEIEKMVGETPEQAKAREAAEAMLNDVMGKEKPSANGKNRPAPKVNERFQPSTNGDFRHK